MQPVNEHILGVRQEVSIDEAHLKTTSEIAVEVTNIGLETRCS